MKSVGSRAEVFHGTAKKTAGGLTKNDLFRGKDGRIKSKRASALAKKNNQLEKAGWGVKKGEFGAVRLGEGDAKSTRRSATRSPRRSATRRSATRRSATRRSATRSPRRSATRRSATRRSATRSPRRSATRSPRRAARRSFF